MKKNLRQQVQFFFRKLLGTEQILLQQQQYQQQLQLQQQKLLLSLGNSLKYFFTEPEKVKATIAYNCCAEIISLLSPMDVKGSKYVRLGKNNDGGYVMLDDFQREKVEAAYSFGICNDVSWDEDVALRGFDVFMYDHTIERLPKNCPKFHFFKTGVTGYEKGANLKTLGELIAGNNHTTCKNLILKMDIEGCEWDVLRETPSSIISQFSQIVMEFHGLKSPLDSLKLEVLKKIHETHQSIHVHANSTGIPLWIGDLVLPPLLEVTYVRRADFRDKFVANTRQFPTEIDQPTFANLPEVYLGHFSQDGGPGEKEVCHDRIFGNTLS